MPTLEGKNPEKMAIAGLFILTGFITAIITAFKISFSCGGFVLAAVLILMGVAFTK
jgi:hypothetical protein